MKTRSVSLSLVIVIGLLDDPRKGLTVLVIILVYQQIENYLFAPRVTAQTMEIHVAVAYGSVIAGAALLGVVGALLALPFAATAQAFVAGYRQHFDVAEDTLAESAVLESKSFTAAEALDNGLIDVVVANIGSDDVTRMKSPSPVPEATISKSM